MIAQAPPVYHLSVDLEIVTVRGTQARTIRLTGPETRFEIPEADTVMDVRLDPHYRILHWTPEFAAEATALAPDTRARLLLQAGHAAEAETVLVHALPEVVQPDLYAATFTFASSLARFAEDRHDWKSAAALAERAIAAPTRRADVLPATYLQLARVSARLGRWERVTFAARAALAADVAAGSRSGITGDAERLLSGARAHGMK